MRPREFALVAVGLAVAEPPSVGFGRATETQGTLPPPVPGDAASNLIAERGWNLLTEHGGLILTETARA